SSSSTRASSSTCITCRSAAARGRSCRPKPAGRRGVEPTGRVTKSAFALLGAAVVLGGLWWVSQASVSPEQRMANAEPPPAAVVDVQLEERVLEDTIIVRGRVVTAESLDVMAPGAGGLDDEGAGGASVVVDTPVAEGDVVEAGDVVAVVSDRPVFVLPLIGHMHSALAPGDRWTYVILPHYALATPDPH